MYKRFGHAILAYHISKEQLSHFASCQCVLAHATWDELIDFAKPIDACHQHVTAVAEWQIGYEVDAP